MPGPAITSQIRALTGGHGCVQLHGERNWASITFSGIRYCFSIEWPDAAALQELVQILPEHEFLIPGYFVADILIRDQSGSRLLVEILIISDPLQQS
jgi:hypothetical protein